MMFINRSITTAILLLCCAAGLHAQTFTTSNLPIVIIDTDGREIPDEPKITATMRIIDNADSNNDVDGSSFTYDGFIGIEVRGQSSQFFPKRGYGVETRVENGNSLNVELMGMPSENDWVIHSPFSDKSLIRNALSYSIASEMMPYAPRVRLAEMVLNQRYHGVILWTEKIKRDKNRVDISTLKDDDNEGDEVTGGYILKFDKGNEVIFTSKFKPNLPHNQNGELLLTEPKIDEITPQQIDYITNYLDDFEAVLMSDSYADPVNGYAKYIDVDSYVNTVLLNELTRNVDGYRLSTYMYKDKDSKGGKLTMGPTWDHNLAWGNADYCNGSDTDGWGYLFNDVCPNDNWVNHVWWERLISDDNFKMKLKKRWVELREGVLKTANIHDRIDNYATALSGAQSRNFQRWNILGTYVWPNQFVGATYGQEIAYLKNWVTDRTNWLDRNFDAITAVQDIADVSEVQVYPNPSNGIINLDTSIPLVRVEIYDRSGRQLIRQSIDADHSVIDLTALTASGILWYRLITEDQEVILGTLVVE